MAKSGLGSTAKGTRVDWKEYGKQWDKRQAQREAAKTPEQRAREKERGEALDRLLKPQMDAAVALAKASGLYPELFALEGGPEVDERPFDEHLTDAGRIHAKGMGIRLD